MKRLLPALVLVMVFGIVIAGCEKMQTEGATTAEDVKSTDVEGEGGMAAPTTPGTVGTITVGEIPFSVEYAVTDEEKASGLMNRESLPGNSGMWFVFTHPVEEEFWMKDTLISLDIIFVGENMKVVHISEDAVPKSLEMISSPVPFMYVLEINGGKAEEFGLEVGDKVESRIGPKGD